MMCEAAPFCSFRRNWLLAFIMSASLCVKSSCQQERILIDTVHVGNKWHLITQNLNLRPAFFEISIYKPADPIFLKIQIKIKGPELAINFIFSSDPKFSFW